MPPSPDRFLHDAMRAGLVLGWLSVSAVLAALVLGVHVERSEVVLGLTAAAAGAHTFIAVTPWRHWLSDRRGRTLLDFWSLGLLAYVALLIIAGGGRTGFDLLLLLVVAFLTLVHNGRRRQLFLAGAALAYVIPMALTSHQLPVGVIALHGVLLCAVAILALMLERAVRREAAARAQAAARAELEHALLAESHHRVKNSLQTVSDLLLLSRPDENDRDGFDKTAIRIRAIAAVHHLLSDRRGGPIHADDLLHAVAAAAVSHTAIKVEADDVLLQPEQAQQLGIVANELLSNAARHGRPPISVRFSIQRDAQLEVHDAGASTRPDADTNGLGLRLVRQVTEHGLHGSFTLAADADGTHANVRFPMVSHAHSDR